MPTDNGPHDAGVWDQIDKSLNDDSGWPNGGSLLAQLEYGMRSVLVISSSAVRGLARGRWLEAERERLMGRVAELKGCIDDYTRLHDHKGGDHIDTGRAWDRMRRAARTST